MHSFSDNLWCDLTRFLSNQLIFLLLFWDSLSLRWDLLACAWHGFRKCFPRLISHTHLYSCPRSLDLSFNDLISAHNLPHGWHASSDSFIEMSMSCDNITWLDMLLRDLLRWAMANYFSVFFTHGFFLSAEHVFRYLANALSRSAYLS